MPPAFLIRPARPDDLEQHAVLRRKLWPHVTRKEHLADIKADRKNPGRRRFVAEGDGKLAGFLEASLRSAADGCYTSPVSYIEGWYVAEAFRRKGLGKKLVAAAEKWARGKGCRDMASDAEIDNKKSIRVHKKLGFTENSRVVTFYKRLRK